jgi:hypothetical protein
MTVSNTLRDLSEELDSRSAALAENEKYLDGKQPMAFLSNAAREATKLSRMVANIPNVQVTAITERMRVTDLLVAGRHSDDLWAGYEANDLDQLLPLAFWEALGLGSSYAIVWDKTGRAKPKVSIESAHQVALEIDPGTRETLSALKRWTAGGKTHARLYLPDAVIAFEADGENAANGWREGAHIRNPLGVVPVVEFRNTARLLGPGVSEAEDLKPLVDANNKLLADLMVGSEFYARPRRWATGVEMGSDDEGNPVNPFPEGDRMMISEAVEAKFGSLPAADLASYKAGVEIIVSMIMAVSALPAHYLGQLTGQAPGADGLRAAEAALSARAEAKQRLFGRPVEAIGRLMEAIRTEANPDDIEVKVRWSDPATRSVAQEADATVKLFQAGLLPTDYALAKLGYDADEIEAIRAARRAEAVERIVITPRQPSQVDQAGEQPGAVA